MPLPLIAGGVLINTLIHDGNGGASNASFSVDIEQIPGLIAKYEEAQRRLQKISERAKELQKIAPPGEDEVSHAMSEKLGEMAGDGHGKLSWSVDQGRQRLQEQIDQLNRALAEYQNADDAARPGQL